MRIAFETERLVVRDWEDDDADRMFDMYRRREVIQYLGKGRQPMESRDVALERISRARARNPEQPPFGFWAVQVRDSGLVVGTSALVPLLDNPGEHEVAWHLHPDSWGNGYATESARGAFALGHAHGVDEILALTYPENTASQAVCHRLGLELLGEEAERYFGIPMLVWLSRTGA
jgi:RimJ/RimL family protein N-acetyltransferase